MCAFRSASVSDLIQKCVRVLCSNISRCVYTALSSARIKQTVYHFICYSFSRSNVFFSPLKHAISTFRMYKCNADSNSNQRVRWILTDLFCIWFHIKLVQRKRQKFTKVPLFMAVAVRATTKAMSFPAFFLFFFFNTEIKHFRVESEMKLKISLKIKYKDGNQKMKTKRKEKKSKVNNKRSVFIAFCLWKFACV